MIKPNLVVFTYRSKATGIIRKLTREFFSDFEFETVVAGMVQNFGEPEAVEIIRHEDQSAEREESRAVNQGPKARRDSSPS